ncbi:polyprenyl synthetase family protein [Nocardia callitridis]|uniref:Polyprenyl synthetase family protein n=1 Tax=Nocardia callitridis TaxID=648753 RepID=A0ABP9KCP5_9NOCA
MMVDIVSTPPQQRAAVILRHARTLCEPVLREAIRTLPEPMSTMAGYHFGWWDTAGSPVHAAGGKALRPALTLGAALACGARAHDAVPAAVAVELVHNFTLLHDDIIDTDRTRRGRPTVWAVWGSADAILLGDALHALAMRVLVAGLPDTVAAAAVARLSGAVVDMCIGQHLDTGFDAGTQHADTSEYVRMATGKTGALMGCAAALGALCAGADGATVSTLECFGRELGLAFQFIDDLMGIWGDPAVTGKPADDLARRSMSLPVIAALESGTPAARELAALYRTEGRAGSIDSTRAAALVEAAGGRRSAQEFADRRVRSAIAAISVLPDRDAAGDLIALAQLASHRER